ncbi:2,3-bisphosphoglycerate-dependent phosphoglycerate mutase [Jatrophihabitans endophyticus]|uniref:2,3-bisphosphoglycerate-dependent phosphoglycerate mutase n=1 Tax=Jatrophihabitans endophyticus TaxID=1206085 RepID=A0A1M5BYI9_9ACTN|nr:histidine phosphatase family protein [Jatrophihabitans endophyticus]SHF47593.1 2,3-bisphosphoglycerate-dependent phosphoglycerate mutase [Jatrophihabitans endophyticus]
MPTVLLVRHGLTKMTGPVLAGRTPGVHLDERGQRQAATLAERAASLPLAAVVTSPLERCVETAGAIRDAQQGQRARRTPLGWHVDDRFIECGYGDWTGKPIRELAKDPLWKTVQAQPSAVRFPNGEALADMSARAVAGVRDWDGRIAEEYGPDAVWVACSHGDVIKAIVADALGLHLDQYQRIVPDPCSVSIVRYTATRPYVVRVNDTGGDLAGFAPPKRRRRTKAADDATVGGGAGGGSV